MVCLDAAALPAVLTLAHYIAGIGGCGPTQLAQDKHGYACRSATPTLF